MNKPETCFESGGEEPPPGSQPWTMEYVARLFIEGGGFQGIANAHNAALEPAKAETEAHLIVMPPVESTATFGSILGHVRHSKLKRLKTRTMLQS